MSSSVRGHGHIFHVFQNETTNSVLRDSGVNPAETIYRNGYQVKLRLYFYVHRPLSCAVNQSQRSEELVNLIISVELMLLKLIESLNGT